MKQQNKKEQIMEPEAITTTSDALEITARVLKVTQVLAIAFAIAQLSIVLAIK